VTGGLATASFYNVAIVVSSIDRAVEWYGRVFGFVEQARGPIAEGTVALMNGAGVTLEILEWGLEEEPIRPEVLFADPPYHLLPVGNKILVFNVDDLSAATTEFEECGVTIVWREKELAPGWRSTAIRDMDGNLINVFQRHAE
jgi:catechol 2,3-dioxygenase-like lactoylglutathione lyase family enzyme